MSMFQHGLNLLVFDLPRHLTEAKATKDYSAQHTCEISCNSGTVSEGNIQQGFQPNKITSAHTSLSFILFVFENPALLQL